MDENHIHEQTDDLKTKEVKPEFPRVKTGIKAGPDIDIKPKP
jgi:hypothetical protein